ncbi:RNA polymerase sigma factor [Lederbergia wuyishanensis]|uniref:RNA polymerase sigma-70 factor (ECF subfamily) n=1 Tax=Lederbergia wuyishanensis TaxID=1347903 RepID=A0ABU0D856_9BACI|nr:sigma-70 family RNA polymerase sigma factor [Lederbergia wuyishanensis]MCJ8009277.1 sigma-70 family RNA polymerase sigma factor [Lederbergia wuyishanensis]MDQ0344589.1 RNA polymerase sigma-70 factor (ECF subfamily) [Lederbergia wuyishanensis]
MKSKTDEELIELIAQNYRPALEELYERYIKLVYSFSLKLTKGDTEKTKEIVQLVFLRLWTTKGTYRSEQGKFPNWLLTITRNIAIDLSRKEKKHSDNIQLELDEWRQMEDHQAEDIQKQVSRNLLKQQIQKAQQNLSEPQRRLINLFYWEGYSLSEIAELEKKPLGTIKSRLHQTLIKLRKYFIEETGGIRNDK